MLKRLLAALGRAGAHEEQLGEELPPRRAQRDAVQRAELELQAEHEAHQPFGGDRHRGPQDDQERNAEKAAGQHPAPVGQRPDGEREDHLGHALDHEEHQEEERRRHQALARIAQEEEADQDGEDDGDELQPEVRYMPRPDQAEGLKDAAVDENSGNSTASAPAAARSTPALYRLLLCAICPD